MIDGDRDRDPYWSTRLSSNGPNEEQKEGEYEQGSQEGRGGYGSREVNTLTKRAILGLARDLTLEGFPGVQGDVPSLFLGLLRREHFHLLIVMCFISFPR